MLAARFFVRRPVKKFFGELSHDIHCPAADKVTKVIGRLKMWRKTTV